MDLKDSTQRKRALVAAGLALAVIVVLIVAGVLLKPKPAPPPAPPPPPPAPVVACGTAYGEEICKERLPPAKAAP